MAQLKFTEIEVLELNKLAESVNYEKIIGTQAEEIAALKYRLAELAKHGANSAKQNYTDFYNSIIKKHGFDPGNIEKFDSENGIVHFKNDNAKEVNDEKQRDLKK